MRGPDTVWCQGRFRVLASHRHEKRDAAGGTGGAQCPAIQRTPLGQTNESVSTSTSRKDCVDRGEDEDTAEEIAARTVNKERARDGEAEEPSRSSIEDISSGRVAASGRTRGPGGAPATSCMRKRSAKNIKGRSKMTKAQLERVLDR